MPTVAPLGRASRVRWTGAIRASASSSRRRDGAQDQRFGTPGGKVLQAVDRDLDGAVEQGALDLLGEQALTADRRQGRVPVAVPLRLDLDQLDHQAGMEHPEPAGDPLGLPARQRTAPRPDPDLADARAEAR